VPRAHRDDHPIEEPVRPLEDVEVSEGDGVEGAGKERGRHVDRIIHQSAVETNGGDRREGA
jgi:hypothetical protein